MLVARSALVSDIKASPVSVQIVAAVVSAAVPNDGGRGWTSFVLLIIELNLICIVGWSSERNAGNAVKELEVIMTSRTFTHTDNFTTDTTFPACLTTITPAQ